MPLTPILKKRSLTPTAGKRVLFSAEPSQRIQSMILNFRDTGDTTLFSDLFSKLHTVAVNEQQAWLSQMTNCVPMLDRRVDKMVLEFLKIPWFWNADVAKHAESFLVTLVTAHNYYTYHILHRLITFLVPEVAGNEEKLAANPGALCEEEKSFYQQVLICLHSVYKHVPMSQDYILILAKKCMPYFRQHVHKHAVYSHNLLLLTTILPHLRQDILEVILSNMVTVDVHAPRAELVDLNDDGEDDGSDEEDMFDMEIDGGGDGEAASAKDTEQQVGMSHESGNTLDVLMTLMLQYVHDTCHGSKVVRGAAESLAESTVESGVLKCRPGVTQTSADDGSRTGGCECGGTQHDVEALKQLFVDLKEIFSHIVLSTHASSHVQFLVFYLLALRPGLATIFLDFLRIKKFENPNCTRDVRGNAMMYIGSLLARGKFIPFSHVHSCLEIICVWCNNYLDKQEETRARNYEDIVLHAPFYFACQTIFYVFTFRYRDYSENTKKLKLARGLNLERLVLSRLNPLRMCAAPVVSNFAAVTRRFQLAYCYTIMENNKRLGIPSARLQDDYTVKTTLDSFFPFDPYLLLRSKRYIISHYREFDGLPEDEEKDQHGVSTRGHEEENLVTVTSPQSFNFSYSTSPGYQKWPGENMALDVITPPGLML